MLSGPTALVSLTTDASKSDVNWSLDGRPTARAVRTKNITHTSLLHMFTSSIKHHLGPGIYWRSTQLEWYILSALKISQFVNTYKWVSGFVVYCSKFRLSHLNIVVDGWVVVKNYIRLPTGGITGVLHAHWLVQQSDWLFSPPSISLNHINITCHVNHFRKSQNLQFP